MITIILIVQQVTHRKTISLWSVEVLEASGGVRERSHSNNVIH